MPTILITGANRGIGLKLAECYNQDGWTVLAACRDPRKYKGPGTAMALKVTNVKSIQALSQKLEGQEIDILWNNAGVYLDKGKTLSTLCFEEWEETFRVNTLAPLRIARALRKNVAASRHRIMAFTTSKMASIGLQSGSASGGAYAYRSSKTALNMAVSVLTQEVAEEGIRTVLLHPGWVRTEMGGESADIGAERSADSMKKVLDYLPEGRSGCFLNYCGTEFPW